MSILAGALAPDSGEMTIDGRPSRRAIQSKPGAQA